MGLDITVGILADLRNRDPEGFRYYKQIFTRLNKALKAENLPEHHEPIDLNGARPLSYQMYGYHGLHYLRRIAAHLWAGKGLPPPGDDQAVKDPLVGEYDFTLGRDSGGVQLPGDSSRKVRKFDHLMFHSDCEGFYVPIKFEEVIFPDRSLDIPGDMVGSSYMLLEECKILAEALELPLELNPESEEVWEAPDNQGQGKVKWKRYGVESFTCLRLYHACKTSINLGAAIVFV